MTRIGNLLAALLLASVSTVASAQLAERAVRIGLAGDDLDACLSLGQVTGLNPRGDNYLAVRAQPNPRGQEKDRLAPGRTIFICDEAGEWLGVVYSPDPNDKPGDCRVGSPVASVRPYSGPCRWGWVSSRYVEVIAG